MFKDRREWKTQSFGRRRIGVTIVYSVKVLCKRLDFWFRWLKFEMQNMHGYKTMSLLQFVESGLNHYQSINHINAHIYFWLFLPPIAQRNLARIRFLTASHVLFCPVDMYTGPQVACWTNGCELQCEGIALWKHSAGERWSVVDSDWFSSGWLSKN